MANAYTDTSAVAGLVKAAYDRYVEFALRSQPQFRALADRRPVQQAMPGSSVVFSLYNDLAAATSTLTETTDPDAVALSNVSTVSVTLNEYGNTVLNTRKLGEFAFSDVDPAIANIVAYNMMDSIDTVVGPCRSFVQRRLCRRTACCTPRTCTRWSRTTFVRRLVPSHLRTCVSTRTRMWATSWRPSLASTVVLTSWRLRVPCPLRTVRLARSCTARSSLVSKLSLRRLLWSRVSLSARSWTS